jgi:hypothetical protein
VSFPSSFPQAKRQLDPDLRGGGRDGVFYENSQTVVMNYELVAGNNAVSAGPVTIQSGVVVTVESGCTWTVV